ncbi:MAG: leucine--tRNA ligase [Candidatus Nanoarchaeia archaeon]|nr:leucine--tRNA ligase [Candidatus Nanoarchaeia archaeon]
MNAKKLEEKWIKRWHDNKIFEAEPDKKRKGHLITFPYPYINCAMHAGHLYTFTRCEVIARYKRMKGYNVLFSQGFHATGEPIMGVSKRIAKKDKSQIEALKKSGIPEKDLQKFSNPEHIVNYFLKSWRKDLTELGTAIDWRRTFYTTKLNPCYNNFITWQYKTLKNMGLVVKGSHPVVYCPDCESATGEHERLRGENATIVEYIAIKFRNKNNEIIPAATLRPETVYGVVNMWINPDVEYVKAKIGNEVWITSEPCFEKMKDQNFNPEKVGKIKGKELLKEKVQNPITKEWLSMHPADFVNPENATGIVMSVPTHAPYDYIALKDIHANFKPIHLIDTPGLGKNPAIKLVEDMKIQNQHEHEKLEKATKQIYKMEFHKGLLNENCGKYKGLMVKDCKERISKDFIKEGYAVILHECSEEVICRCTKCCHIKLIQNQWFLKYSDEKWKRETLKHLSKMKIYPEEARNWLENSVKGMKDKACARKSGLGTPLPWDKEWIIESLSDSTIYMAFYIIQKFVTSGKVKERNLNADFFDYVLLGKKITNIEKKTGLKKGIIDGIKKEFDYFYPVDMRVSAKDLLSHHLPFFIFHHVALFKPSKRPVAISANGYVKVDGAKMSKSLGNFITMRDALDKYGADATRLASMDTSEGLMDADLRRENAVNFKRKIDIILETAKNIKTTNRKSANELWLLSVIQQHIHGASKALDELKNRTALQHTFHAMWNDISEYLKRTDLADKETINYAFDVFARMNAPFAPFFCEELWEILGNNGFVSNAEWPKIKRSFINKEVEEGVELFKNVENDINGILKLVKTKPKKITLFVSQTWRYDVFGKIKSLLGKDFRMIMSEMMKSNEAKKHGKEVAGIVEMIVKNPSRMPDIIIPKSREISLLNEMSLMLKEKYHADVEIVDADSSKDIKAMKAMPFKPGILIE